MRLLTLIRRELVARRGSTAVAIAAVVAGIALLVALRSVLQASEQDIAYKLDGLGANVLVLPRDTAVADYYSADLGGAVFPEAHVTRLALSDLEGLDNVSPKLSLPVTLGDATDAATVTLTGILPRAEFVAKGSWKGAGVFARPTAECAPETDTPPAIQQDNAVRRKRIETLHPTEILVGADVALAHSIEAGSTVRLLDRTFQALEVLPTTGTVDDTRIFAHLHTVQEMAKAGEVVNAIEIVGCCREIAKGLADGVARLLPDTRVVTISQIADTQIRTNKTMGALSGLIWVLAALLGGGGILAAMIANVRERRREFGVLMAMGAQPTLLGTIVGLKALLLGLTGGLLGWALGALLAVWLGPALVGVHVGLRTDLLPLALGVSIVIALVGGLLPAYFAAGLSPADALRTA